jgi:predicted RNase H-like HicB family nuclease
MAGKVRRSGPKRRRGGSLPFLLHVLVYQDAEEWLAHCLEFDTVAQGGSPAEARKGLENALGALIADAVEHDDVRGLFRPAPLLRI